MVLLNPAAELDNPGTGSIGKHGGGEAASSLTAKKGAGPVRIAPDPPRFSPRGA
jgi:hypothetical protein